MASWSIESSLGKFDPTNYPGAVYDNFCEFVDSYAYVHLAITKEPPESANTQDLRAAWHEQNKRHQFLGHFTSHNLQKDFEDSVPKSERHHLFQEHGGLNSKNVIN